MSILGFESLHCPIGSEKKEMSQVDMVNKADFHKYFTGIETTNH